MSDDCESNCFTKFLRENSVTVTESNEYKRNAEFRKLLLKNDFLKVSDDGV
jgi:hypothetical protein